MANPQVEDGFTRIANELYDKIIQFDFRKRQSKIVHCIIRYTYGFGKIEAEMNQRFIALKTDLDLRDVSRTLTELVIMGVLAKRQQGDGYIIGLIKNYDSWKVLAKRQRGGKLPTDKGQNANTTVGKTPTHIKKTLKKTSKEKDPPTPQGGRPHSDYVNAWNFIARKFGWSEVQKMTGQRTRWLKARIADPDFDWKKILQVATESKGLHAQQWFGFDFLIRNDTHYVRVLEGKYTKAFGSDTKPIPPAQDFKRL